MCNGRWFSFEVWFTSSLYSFLICEGWRVYKVRLEWIILGDFSKNFYGSEMMYLDRTLPKFRPQDNLRVSLTVFLLSTISAIFHGFSGWCPKNNSFFPDTWFEHLLNRNGWISLIRGGLNKFLSVRTKVRKVDSSVGRIKKLLPLFPLLFPGRL